VTSESPLNGIDQLNRAAMKSRKVPVRLPVEKKRKILKQASDIAELRTTTSLYLGGKTDGPLLEVIEEDRTSFVQGSGMGTESLLAVASLVLLSKETWKILFKKTGFQSGY
jgi:hypothetical protein